MKTNIPSQVFEIAVRNHGDAVCITDSALDAPGPTVLFVNDAFTKLTGYHPTQIIGKNPRVLQGPLTDRLVLAELRNRLSHAERFEGETINYRADGSPFVMYWTIDPVVDAFGSCTHFIAIQYDVTAVRQEQRLRTAERTLGTAAIALADHDDPNVAADLLAGHIKRAVDGVLLAGQCSVITRHLRTTNVFPATNPEERNRFAALLRQHRNPAAVSHRHGREIVVPFPGIAGGVVVGGLDATSERLVPMDHLTDLATTAATGLGALASIAQRRQETIAVQRVLSPPHQFDLTGFATVVRYVPSRRTEQAGGDWYDAIEVPGGVRLVIGDVVGKGLRAAAEMGLLRAHLHAQLATGEALPLVVADADTFCREEGIVATAAVVDIEADTGDVAMVTAGHPPPLIAGDGGVRYVDAHPAPPLGAFREPEPPATESTARLHTGEVLVMFTDGALDERTAGIGRGLASLAARLATTDRDVRSVAEAVIVGADPERADDVAVLTISRSG